MSVNKLVQTRETECFYRFVGCRWNCAFFVFCFFWNHSRFQFKSSCLCFSVAHHQFSTLSLFLVLWCFVSIFIFQSCLVYLFSILYVLVVVTPISRHVRVPQPDVLAYVYFCLFRKGLKYLGKWRKKCPIKQKERLMQ